MSFRDFLHGHILAYDRHLGQTYCRACEGRGDELERPCTKVATFSPPSPTPMNSPLALDRAVLDHGIVRLVDSMGNDLSIVRSARVSHDGAWRAGIDEGSDARLIRYLWKHGHTTPFESVAVTFEIKAPIFVLRQWHRHRTQSYNELSARYRELPEEFYVPDPAKIGVQSTNNKQARTIADTPIGEADLDLLARREEEVQAYKLAAEASFAMYRALLSQGWPRELARSVLPVSTYSHMFATMNLLNLFRFLTLRLHPHAQYEIRVYAEAMFDLAKSIAPVAFEAFAEGLAP